MDEADSIAIDGPVACGKTAVGTLLAERLSFRFLDTGVMYRAVTLAAIDRGIELTDEAALGALASEMEMEVVAADGGSRLSISGEDVTDRLRSGAVDRGVSLVASVPAVRSALVSQQRRIAGGGGIVMVGRDIGTVVLPRARAKVFLTASVRTRASRRYREQLDVDGAPGFEQLMGEIERRDKIDSERADSPLRAADDALVLDTDSLNVEEVVERILSHIGSG